MKNTINVTDFNETVTATVTDATLEYNGTKYQYKELHNEEWNSNKEIWNIDGKEVPSPISTKEELLELQDALYKYALSEEIYIAQ